jgi:hypothetical protein
VNGKIQVRDSISREWSAERSAVLRRGIKRVPTWPPLPVAYMLHTWNTKQNWKLPWHETEKEDLLSKKIVKTSWSAGPPVDAAVQPCGKRSVHKSRVITHPIIAYVIY